LQDPTQFEQAAAHALPAANTFNNHSNSPIPDRETVSGWKIAMVIVGISITLPAFLVGAEVMFALGALQGLAAIVCAGAILTVVAILTMLVGAKCRLSTYNILQFPFGQQGAKYINLLLSLSLFGWFGVTATLFGQACQQAVLELFALDLPSALYTALGSLLMVCTALFGFSAIERLSRLAVPLMLLVLLSSVVTLMSDYSLAEVLAIPGHKGPLSEFSIAVSAIVGAFMVGATIVSDMSRFSRGSKDSLIGSLLSYGSGSLLILIAAGIPSLVTGEKDLMNNLYQTGLGAPALVIMILATWTTNTNNLYSASLGIAQVLPRVPDGVITLACGVLGGAFGLLGIMEYFVDFLLILGVAIPPLAGIYLVDFYRLHRSRYELHTLASQPPVNWRAYLAWVCGILAGLLSSESLLQITTVPACDAMLTGGLSYWVLNRNSRHLSPDSQRINAQSPH
jgi:cytosine permease